MLLFRAMAEATLLFHDFFYKIILKFFCKIILDISQPASTDWDNFGLLRGLHQHQIPNVLPG